MTLIQIVFAVTFATVSQGASTLGEQLNERRYFFKGVLDIGEGNFPRLEAAVSKSSPLCTLGKITLSSQGCRGVEHCQNLEIALRSESCLASTNKNLAL